MKKRSGWTKLLYQGNSHQLNPAENMVAAGTGHGRSGRNDAKFTGIVGG